MTFQVEFKYELRDSEFKSVAEEKRILRKAIRYAGVEVKGLKVSEVEK